MKFVVLIAVLCLGGCGGPEFTAAELRAQGGAQDASPDPCTELGGAGGVGVGGAGGDDPKDYGISSSSGQHAGAGAGACGQGGVPSEGLGGAGGAGGEGGILDSGLGGAHAGEGGVWNAGSGGADAGGEGGALLLTPEEEFVKKLPSLVCDEMGCPGNDEHATAVAKCVIKRWSSEAEPTVVSICFLFPPDSWMKDCESWISEELRKVSAGATSFGVPPNWTPAETAESLIDACSG